MVFMTLKPISDTFLPNSYGNNGNYKNGILHSLKAFLAHLHSLTLLFQKAKHFPMLEIFILSVFLTFIKKIYIQKEKFKCN